MKTFEQRYFFSQGTMNGLRGSWDLCMSHKKRKMAKLKEGISKQKRRENPKLIAKREKRLESLKSLKSVMPRSGTCSCGSIGGCAGFSI
jgi:hypothetical protein